MKSNIKVTFLMMAYNVEASIEKAIQSVLNQTVREVEIFVRNNGSTDKTGEILQRLAAEDNRIIITTNKTNGKTDDGIKIYEKGWWIPDKSLAGEYISILDGDDYLEPDFVEIMYHSAKQNNADITAAGNYFVSDDGVYGSRVPEALISDSLKIIESVFPSIYNCFRTWWGKLYNTEFFFSEYDYAWECHPPMDWVLDTILMLKYLERCRKLVTISKPLYNMYVRTDSTYKTRTVDYGILWGAHALFQNNMKFITQNGIATRQNNEFVVLLHWTYLMEGIQPFKHNTQISPSEKLFHIKTLLNDSIVGQYSLDLFEQMYQDLLPYLIEIEYQADLDLSIYSHYIMRLKCFIDSAQEDETNPLNYPLLLGVLFDPVNRNWFGLKFIQQPLQSGSAGVRREIQRQEGAWTYWSENPSIFINDFCNAIDRTPAVKEAENDLIGYWNENRYEECYVLADEISKVANFNREAMYYRIKILEHFGEYTTAVILAYTARILYNSDTKMQALCNSILKKRSTHGTE